VGTGRGDAAEDAGVQPGRALRVLTEGAGQRLPDAGKDRAIGVHVDRGVVLRNGIAIEIDVARRDGIAIEIDVPRRNDIAIGIDSPAVTASPSPTGTTTTTTTT
jgi:hypothetical protein